MLQTENGDGLEGEAADLDGIRSGGDESLYNWQSVQETAAVCAGLNGRASMVLGGGFQVVEPVVDDADGARDEARFDAILADLRGQFGDRLDEGRLIALAVAELELEMDVAQPSQDYPDGGSDTLEGTGVGA